MLTPAFELTQDDEYLIVSIQVPYAKISEVEVDFDDDTFMFYSKPYYLRLNLPRKVVYQDEPSIKYDVDKRIFTIKAPKANKGEEFENLDLITLLLAPKKKKASSAPLIEVLEGSNNVEECEEFDWSVELKPSEDRFGDITFSGQQCGFNNSYSFSIFNLEEEVNELFEVTEPQKKAYQTRREERITKESSLFDEDHYIADLYQDDEIQHLIKLPWDAIYENVQNNSSDLLDSKINFTQEEKALLRKFPNKEYLLDKDQQKAALLGLIDILFAFAYNKRITEGENTVMSAWAINRLSATFSWFEVFTSIQDVVITCLRRSLIYPLYRHFELSLTVLEDVIKLLKLGRRYVMKCLLEIHKLFSESEPRYILNDLYVKDYNVWIQGKKCSSKTLVSLAEALEKVLLTKGDIGLSLVNIESFAAVAWMNRESTLSSNSPKTKKQSRSVSENNAEQSQNSNESNLCSQIENLSLSPNLMNGNEDACSEKCSDCDCSNSSTTASSDSDSSDSDSSDSDSDSSQDSDDSSSKTDSDGDTSDLDSDSNVYSNTDVSSNSDSANESDSDTNREICSLLNKIAHGGRIL